MPEYIVVCDDDAHIRSTLRYVLAQAGFEVETFDNGQDAWHRIQSEPPALVITNQNRSGLDGIELARLVRADETFAGTSIILLTARVLELSEQQLSQDVGIDVVLAKPINPQELVRLAMVLTNRDVSD